MTFWQQLSCALFVSLAGMPAASAQSGTDAPSLEIIVERMAKARNENRARLRPYVVTRDYALYGAERDSTKSKVTAELTFVPPNVKKYSILERTGSGLGERLVRRILDGETEIVREYGATDLTPNNYDFRFAGEETMSNRRCYLIELLPKRMDKNLLRATVWVDAHTYLLHRLEGEPARSPSWWLRDSRITFFYGNVEGMWLQTASEITTHVRVFGQHTMISHDVKYETGELATSGAGAKAPLRSSSPGERNLLPGVEIGGGSGPKNFTPRAAGE